MNSNEKILNVKELQTISIEKLIDLYRTGHVLELTEKDKNILSKISTLVSTCPSTGKYVGQSVTVSATPSGGTPTYTVVFKRNGVDIPNGTFTGVPEGTTKSIAYTTVVADTPSVILSAIVTDSCPTGAKTSPLEQCTVTVSACAVPTCNFTIT